ncbi:MAG: PEP-CTERM sorting domain-containing protein [Planctomycetaceae bacterium]|nr:PEP-CTERM sorting domain-containing protein [Planctomycetaceae bacterium]
MKKSNFLLAVLIISCMASMSFGVSAFFRDDLSEATDDYHWSDTTAWYLINDVGSPALGRVPLITDTVFLYFQRETVVNSDAFCNSLFVGYWNEGAKLTLAPGDYTLKVNSQLLGGRSGTGNVITQNGGTFRADVGVRLGYDTAETVYNMNAGTLTTAGAGVVTRGIVVGTGGDSLKDGSSTTFNQTGGTVTTGELAVGKAGTTGIYNLTGGTINGIYWSTNFKIGAIGSAKASIKSEFNLGNAVSTGTITGSADASLYIDCRNSSLNGWGVIQAGSKTSTASRLFNDGTIKADGFGIDRTLDVSNYNRVVSNSGVSGAVNTGTNGYYAVNHGKLLLPSVTVAAGNGAYNWGEDAARSVTSLVNSVRVTFTNASEGSLDIALLANDRTDVVAYDGKTFIGIWSFAQMTFDNANIAFRYDEALAAGLGIDEESLNIFKLEGTNWVALASTVDSINNRITANVDEFSVFAVGVPEPATVILLGLGLSLLGRKRK